MSYFTRIILFSAFLFFIIGASRVFADHGLQPQGFVSDFANLFSSQFRGALEKDLQNFEKETGNEIAIVTISSLEGIPIEDYTVKLFEEWGIGKKNKDNGLLLLIARDDREVRIEVGYGLEPYVTDGRAGDIIRTNLVPNFKEGDYEGGVSEALVSLKGYIVNKTPEPMQEPVRRGLRRLFFSLFLNEGLGFFLLIILSVYLFDFLARTKNFWLGGVFGGGLGICLGWLFISFLLGAIFFISLGGVGLLLDYLLSHNYQKRKAMGLPTSFWTSGGGFRSGGGRGGFGGFGGGMSGGGGASGHW